MVIMMMSEEKFKHKMMNGWKIKGLLFQSKDINFESTVVKIILLYTLLNK